MEQLSESLSGGVSAEEGTGSSEPAHTTTSALASANTTQTKKSATTKRAETRTPAETQSPSKPKAQAKKEDYACTVTSPKGQKYIVKKDSSGKYHYYSASGGAELNEQYFAKQTGLANGDVAMEKMRAARADRADKAKHHTAGIRKEGRTVTITLDNGKTFTKRASGIRWNGGELNGLEKELKAEIQNQGYKDITYQN